jgi:hypothetical protein
MGERVMSGLRSASAPQYYSVVVGMFLCVRGLTTLFSGPDFSFPGDGWRAVAQVVIAVVLFACVARRTAALRAVIAVGVVYLAETLLGLIDGRDILGVIPVDMRDKIVHPTLAILALVAVGITLSMRPRSVVAR